MFQNVIKGKKIIFRNNLNIHKISNCLLEKNPSGDAASAVGYKKKSIRMANIDYKFI